MYNTYRFETKVWQLLCGRDGEKKKIGFVNKNRSRKRKQKVPQIFFRSSPYSDSFGPIWVVRSYSNMEVIDKKFKAPFGFFTVKILILLVYELLKITYYNKVNFDFVL